MLFIGDVHGKYRQYEKIISSCTNSIQVGDMGVGFIDPRDMRHLANPPYDKMLRGRHRFIRGNHDNPGACRKHSQWIKDGLIENNMMFIGGASSIDKHHRTPGFTWWEDEELSQRDLELLLDIYAVTRPEVMVTHECPAWVAVAMGHRLYKTSDQSRTRAALAAMHEVHKPRIWIFGHWHISYDNVIDDTRWVCLNELEVKEIEI